MLVGSHVMFVGRARFSGADKPLASAPEEATLRIVASPFDILPHELVLYASLNETSMRCKRKVESP
jgi:hypothetical protein